MTCDISLRFYRYCIGILLHWEKKLSKRSGYHCDFVYLQKIITNSGVTARSSRGLWCLRDATKDVCIQTTDLRYYYYYYYYYYCYCYCYYYYYCRCSCCCCLDKATFAKIENPVSVTCPLHVRALKANRQAMHIRGIYNAIHKCM